MARAVRKRRLRTGGILMMLGVLFGGSVALRLSDFDFDVVAPAVASDPDPIGDVAGPTSPIRAALDEVEALRDRLLVREAELDDRERAVDAAQALVEARLIELEAAETRLEALIQTSDQAAEGDIAQLTDVYQAMAPEQTAALFSQMAPSFSAGFLTRMTPDASAAIMAELDPAVAYAISVVIATRNAGAPTLSDPDEGAPPDTES